MQDGVSCIQSVSRASFKAAQRRNGQRLKGVYLRDGIYYARIKNPTSGKWSWVRSPDQSADGAARIVTEASRAVGTDRAERFTEALEGARIKRTWPTVEEAMAAYANVAEARRALTGRPREPTQRDAQNAVAQILREMGEDTALAVDRLPDVVRAWSAQRIQDGAKRLSVGSTLRAARSAFAGWAWKDMTHAGLRLPPNLRDHWPTISSEPRFYQLPERELRERTLVSGRRWFVHRTDLGLAFALCFYAGMSRADAIEARWAWIVDGHMVYHRRKTGRRADPPLPEDVLAILAEWPGRAEREHILPGTVSQREALIDRQLSRWMRKRGWQTEKLAHELRKLACSYWATQCGIQWASKWLGDSESTASKYYRDLVPEAAPMPDMP